MNFSDLPESARLDIEVAQNEADAILGAARRSADQFVAKAYEMGVDPSGVGFSPGDSALALARQELIAGRDRAAGHLLGAIVGEYLKTNLGIDGVYSKIAAGGDFVASRYQLDRSTLDQLTQYCQATALRVKSNEVKLQARAAGGPLTLAEWGTNPFPTGSTAHQILEDCALLARERLALFAAEQFGKLPAENSPNEDFLKFQVECVAGVFDVWAGILADSCPLTDAAAHKFCELCGELEKILKGQTSERAISGVSRQTYLSAMKTRLLQRKHSWIGQMFKKVREHKQAIVAVSPGEHASSSSLENTFKQVPSWSNETKDSAASAESLGGMSAAVDSSGELAVYRAHLLSDYKAATGQPSNKRIYQASNSTIHKPEFYEWVRGELPSASETTRNFERFLREKKPPIPRNPGG